MSLNIKKSLGHKSSAGFTLIEVIVTIAIFAILASAMLETFLVLTTSVKKAREKITLSSLASDYLEVVRNMPYSKIGTIHGNPTGTLADIDDPSVQTIGPTTYNMYYKVAYIHDPADSATGTPDYKQVKMSILNNSSKQVTDFVTTVVPQGLISNPNTGALQVSVINSQGQPLAGAGVEIRYPTSSPYTYDLFDTTNSSGQITEVGLPAGVNAYRIIASEAGYSTDLTYPITKQNPSPYHPDATVANGKVTQLTLSIDQTSTLNIQTLNQICQPLSNVNVNIHGAKLIGTPTGTPPSIGLYKYYNNFGSTAGAINLTGMEWDTYTPTLLTGQSYIIYGTSPIQQISILPNTTETFSMILGSNTTSSSLLVIVKDASTGAALENASVQLIPSSGPTLNGTTGGSVWLQNNWQGGSGQTQWSTTTPNEYNQDNGQVDVSTAGLVTLKKTGGNYTTATGTLTSSTFDTGTSATNYTILSWLPSSQSASTSLVFQVAANNDKATWNFVGPDGTANTYFTVPGTDMGSILDNNEYVRYKALLNTTNTSKAPSLTSVSVNFVTGCFTPGQTIFTGLTAGAYHLTVSLAGYQTQSNISLPNVNGNQSFEVDMSH